MFNLTPNDEQLIDFLVTFGDSFPEKDSDGNPIERSKHSPGENYSSVSY